MPYVTKVPFGRYKSSLKRYRSSLFGLLKCPSLSLSLSGVKLGFLPSQMTGQAGKKFISLLGGDTRWQRKGWDLSRLLTILRTKDFHNKLDFNTRFNLQSWYVQVHQILIKY